MRGASGLTEKGPLRLGLKNKQTLVPQTKAGKVGPGRGNRMTCTEQRCSQGEERSCVTADKNSTNMRRETSCGQVWNPFVPHGRDWFCFRDTAR